MPQPPKRIPGERNPGVDPTQARQIQNATNASAGAGGGDFGAGAVIAAFIRWRQRRRQRKAIAAHEAAKRDQ
jgi:hypothetical protein